MQSHSPARSEWKHERSQANETRVSYYGRRIKDLLCDFFNGFRYSREAYLDLVQLIRKTIPGRYSIPALSTLAMITFISNRCSHKQ